MPIKYGQNLTFPCFSKFYIRLRLKRIIHMTIAILIIG